MATVYVFANNVSTTLAAAITSTSQTTATLSSAANLPTIPGGDVLALTFNDAATGNVYEIVYVTAHTGANITMLRGQEGTTAQTWLVGDLAFASDTAGILGNFAQSATAGAIAIDTSATAQAKAGAFTAGGLTSTAGIAVGGALTGATSGSFSGNVSTGNVSGATGTFTNGVINIATIANNMTMNGGAAFTQGDLGLAGTGNTGRIWFGQATGTPKSFDYGVGAAGYFTANASLYVNGVFGFFATGATSYNMAPVSNDIQFRANQPTGQFDFMSNTGGAFAQINASVFNVSSDRNLKDDIEPLGLGTDTVMALKPVSYTLKADGQKHIGFIAQDVESIIPTAVTRRSSIVDEDENTIETLGLNYIEFIPYIVAMLQEQHDAIAALKAQ